MNRVYESILNMISFYDKEQSILLSKQQTLYEELMKRLKEDTGIDCPETFIRGEGCDCPTSPIKTCVYDGQKDPCCDDCIYCHQPFERK